MSSSLDLDRAPTLDELLRGCVDAFDAQGKVRDPQLVRLFLATHPWYLPQAEVAGKLLTLVQESGGSAEGPSLRLKIGHLVRYWVRAFPRELSGDPQVLGRLRELGAALGGDPQTPLGLESLPEEGDDEAEGDNGGGAGGVPGGGPAGGPSGGVVAPPRARFSMLLEPLEPPELALLLTHLEHRGFGRLRLRDIRAFARSAGTSSSPALRRLVALSNGLSRWVQLRVLRPLAAPQRAAALGQCLHLAQSLLELRNFNSLLAVVGGLGHGSIARLRRTLALLDPPLIQLWAQLAEAVGSGGNYRRYRALLGGAGGAGGFRVPALGVHLRDLVSLEAALPDWEGPGRPHPNKLRARFALQGVLLAGREQGPPGTPHPDLLRLLEVSLALGPSEEQLHQMSLQREPRESAPAGPPPELPPALPPERWVLPEPPRPDPEGLRPRLEQLVESIFRNFDVDGDGRISVEEFGIVRENFPHLPPLGELDTDMDGGLSRGEVLDYFLRCSQGPPPGPPHNFRGLRGLRAGPCETCGKLIWGLHKDGMECSGCGLRCHISCRERLRPECRRRAQSVAAPPPDAPAPPKSRPRSFSLSLPWPRRASLRPSDPPEEEEDEDGVFDTHL